MRLINHIIILAAACICSMPAIAQTWLPDSLGADFQMRYVTQPSDRFGAERCTIMRDTATTAGSKRGILYIHGFNDYFFQKEMAEKFVSQGYNFHAVDLRRYGRSIIPGQRPFDVRSLDEYFPDIDSALTVMQHTGLTDITLMGHSTGGLIATYYMLKHPDAPVRQMILNSPFLDWNLGRIEWLVPVVSAIGAVFPEMKISQGDGTVYGQSLDSLFHGEWNYNRAWKMHRSPDVTAGWVRAIDRAQRFIDSHQMEIRIPVLLMCSTASYYGDDWTEDAQYRDAVLDVNDIVRIGTRLGRHVTLVRVEGGMHDLFLSSRPVRTALYRYVFKWLSNH